MRFFSTRRRVATCLAAALLMAAPLAKASQDGFAEGEVRKVDTAGGRLTVKHGEIPSMDMPPMTMVFELRDKSQLAQLKPGDKLRFKATNEGGRLMITELQRLK